MKTPIAILSVLFISASALAQTPGTTSPPSGTPPSASPPSSSAPGANQPSAPPFEVLDANADGRLTSTEAQADRVLASKFAMVDKQGKGYISKEEYLAYLRGDRKGS
jgi:hypothetical protein